MVQIGIHHKMEGRRIVFEKLMQFEKENTCTLIQSCMK